MTVTDQGPQVKGQSLVRFSIKPQTIFSCRTLYIRGSPSPSSPRKRCENIFVQLCHWAAARNNTTEAGCHHGKLIFSKFALTGTRLKLRTALSHQASCAKAWWDSWDQWQGEVEREMTLVYFFVLPSFTSPFLGSNTPQSCDLMIKLIIHFAPYHLVQD